MNFQHDDAVLWDLSVVFASRNLETGRRNLIWRQYVYGRRVHESELLPPMLYDGRAFDDLFHNDSFWPI